MSNMISDAFFFIDTNNLQDTESKLFGYMLTNQGIITNSSDAEINGEECNGLSGAYVYVYRNRDEITISQDYLGSYGIYLYEEDDYFALSNSFAYLVEKLKVSRELNLNLDFANMLLVESLCVYSVQDTLFKEIRQLKRNDIVKINIMQRKIQLLEVDYQENTIAIDSQRGMDVLDCWYKDWIRIIREIHQQTPNLQVDLSGGIDSRITFGLFSKCGVTEKGFIRTIEDKLHTHAEDYRIAKEIATSFGFLLNDTSNLRYKEHPLDVEDIINLSEYVKFGFHKQMYWKRTKPDEWMFMLTGNGGECIRKYWTYSEKDAEIVNTNRIKNLFPNLKPGIKTEIVASIVKETRKCYSDLHSKFERFGRSLQEENISDQLYREGRARYHFGKGSVENYLSGRIGLYPLLDPKLHQLQLNTDLCGDRNLLVAVIFTRFFPELLNYPFEGNRSIDHNTIAMARHINDLFPMKNNTEEGRSFHVPVQKEDCISDNKGTVSKEQLDSMIESVFLSKGMKNILSLVYDESIYEGIKDKTSKTSFQKMVYETGAITIGIAIRDIMFYPVLSATECNCFAESIQGFKGPYIPRLSDTPADVKPVYIEELENKLEQVYHSKSYRLGNAFMKPMKCIKDKFLRIGSSGTSK